MMHFIMTLRIAFVILISTLIPESYTDFASEPMRPDEASIIRGDASVNTSGNNIEKIMKSIEEICEDRDKKIIFGLVGLIIILCISLLLTALGQLCPWKYIICQCERGCIGRNWHRFKNCSSNCQRCRNFCNVSSCCHSEATNPQVIRYDGRNVLIQQQI